MNYIQSRTYFLYGPIKGKAKADICSIEIKIAVVVFTSFWSPPMLEKSI